MGFNTPKAPPAPPPQPIAAAQVTDDIDARVDEAARARRIRERQRRGLGSLVIDPSTSAPGGTGLSIS